MKMQTKADAKTCLARGVRTLADIPACLAREAQAHILLQRSVAPEKDLAA